MKNSKQLIAIAFSDLHIHQWKKHNDKGHRLYKSLDVLRYLGNIASKENIPILFAGDLFEDPKSLTNEVIVGAFKSYKKFIQDKGVNFYAISGNHDMSERNTDKRTSPSYLHAFEAAFPSFKLMDNKRIWQANVAHTDIDVVVFGIPYLNQNEGLSKLVKNHRVNINPNKINILMIHTDLWGALDTDGREVGTTQNLPKNLKKFFKGFDIVLSGHIHKPQVIVDGHIYMIGAPQQQKTNDSGCEMGYWEIYSDKSVKFKPLTQYSKFIYLEHDEPKPDNHNFYIHKPAPIQEVDASEEKFDPKEDKEKLAKRYCKVTGVKSKKKKKVLTNLLKNTD